MEILRMLNLLRMYLNLKIRLNGKYNCKLAAPFMQKKKTLHTLKCSLNIRGINTSRAGSDIL